MDIAFTFGIITYVNNGIPSYLIDAVSTIRRLNIPEYEIVLVGNESILRADYHFETHWQDLKIINFDENVKDKWITRKKNLITQNAKYENIVYQHDYFIHLDDWYEGFKTFGDQFTICLSKMRNLYVEGGRESDRFRDLVLDYWSVGNKLKKLGIPEKHCLIPYEEFDSRLTPHMYISGGYWIAKKSFMAKYPLNEALCWGQGEDHEWSKRIRNHAKISFNPHSTIKVNKPANARIFDPMSVEDMQKFKRSIGL